MLCGFIAFSPTCADNVATVTTACAAVVSFCCSGHAAVWNEWHRRVGRALVLTLMVSKLDAWRVRVRNRLDAYLTYGLFCLGGVNSLMD